MIKNNQKFAGPEQFHITGNWGRVSERLQFHFESLTDADVILESGREEELLKRIADRIGISRERVIATIQSIQGGG